MRDQVDGNGVASVQHEIEEVQSQLLNDENIRERVALRAYELYQQRGGEHGRHLDDWAQAESEVLTSLFEQVLQAAERAGARGNRRAVPDQTLSSVNPDKPVQRMFPVQATKTGSSVRNGSTAKRHSCRGVGVDLGISGE